MPGFREYRPARASGTLVRKRWRAVQLAKCSMGILSGSKLTWTATKAAWTWSAPVRRISAPKKGSPCSHHGRSVRTWLPIPSYHRTLGCGPRCNWRGAGPGPAAFMMSTKSWTHWRQVEPHCMARAWQSRHAKPREKNCHAKWGRLLVVKGTTASHPRRGERSQPQGVVGTTPNRLVKLPGALVAAPLRKLTTGVMR